MSKFQIITIIVILAIVTLAILIISGVLPGLPGGSSQPQVALTLWGTLPAADLNPTISLFNSENQKKFFITYVEQDKENFDEKLVNALAAGTGPDFWIISQDLILKHQDKIYKIPFTSFSERNYRDLFVDAADLFILKQEIIGAPFLIDPLVLYYNKDAFNKMALALPPSSWEEFLNYATLLTNRNEQGFIVQSGAAMGEFSNILNAKEIFSMLVLQSGNKIVAENKERGELELVFGERENYTIDPAESALNFYLNFSNPTKVSYSWNRALPDSRQMFVSGKLAMYFGFASEYEGIKESNPHLNFDVVKAPQVGSASLNATFGRVYGLVVSKSSKNVGPAMEAVFTFVGKDNLARLASDMKLPSSRRDLLAEEISDPALSVFYKSALQSRAWLEPDPEAVSVIFNAMINSAVTGKKRISDAVKDAETLLEAELQEVR